jgi:hypothetical protein
VNYYFLAVLTGFAILSLSMTTSTIAGLPDENACSSALSSSSGRSTLNPSPPHDFAKSAKFGLMNSIPNSRSSIRSKRVYTLFSYCILPARFASAFAVKHPKRASHALQKKLDTEKEHHVQAIFLQFIFLDCKNP